MSSDPILLVEDDPDIRENLCAFLELEGFTVRTASHGQEALDYLEAEGPARLILLDLMMPVLNGYEFLERLREPGFKAFAETPIILISAATDIARTAKSYGISFLAKPIRLDQLLSAIASTGAQSARGSG